MSKSLMVLGGAGFIGTNLLFRLLDDNHFDKVTVIDALTYVANQAAVDLIRKTDKFEFIKGSVCDAELIEEQVKQHTHIINLAAETFVDNSIKNSAVFLETNIRGTHVLLEAIRKIGNRKLLHVSTDEVWGEIIGNKVSNEQSPYRPRNPYAASKASADLFTIAFGATYDIDYNIIYYSNLYGPWQYPEKLIPKFITHAITETKLPIYGDGSQIRTWLHVEDAISGLLNVLIDAKPKETYAISSQFQANNLEVTKLILDYFGLKEDLISYVEDRLGHDFRYAADSSKMQLDFGWKPTIHFDDGLRSTIKWYVENDFWWNDKIVTK